ncbi:hypothetical protein ACFW1A_36300 [Kitasatospora sp. NPDC058965]|uniref:hypothetical protein n=1 Tax=Kitasatospora sp. NPDC058965 TaxID=3346682 RepID=UPI0036AB8813
MTTAADVTDRHRDTDPASANASRRSGPAWLLRSLWLLCALAATLVTGLCAQAITSWYGVLGPIGTALIGSVLACLTIGLGAAASRLLALPPGRARQIATAVIATGTLPWLLPTTLRMPTAATGLPLTAVWTANAAIPLLLTTAVLPARRTRQAAAIAAAATLLAWLPLRHLVMTSAVNHAIHRLGNPSPTLLRQVDWPAMTPSTFHYTNGRITLEYMSDGPTPDATDAVLTIAPAATSSPCDLPLPLSLGIQPTHCRPAGPSLWSRADCALVLQTDNVLIELAESGPACPPEEQNSLQTVIRSQQPVNESQLLDLTD